VVCQIRRWVERFQAITIPDLPAPKTAADPTEPRIGGNWKSWSRTSCEVTWSYQRSLPVAASSTTSESV
jgi:hypothetical protein